jgi:phospholipid-binding lipoprotein MlaA
MVAGCAADPEAPNDPLEPMNRFFFDVNQRLDRHAALPAATFYSSAVPSPVRGSLHNVLSNLGGPVTFVNDVLEAEFENAGIAASRFVINSTIGVAGVFDVATDWGLPGRDRDFGETLGTYGVAPGPYLVLPLRGPTSVRDFGGSYVDGFFSPLYYVRYDGRPYVGIVKSSIGSMDNRSANIVTYRDIERASVDYYATMRAYYLQRRARQVEEKNVQTAELPDF